MASAWSHEEGREPARAGRGFTWRESVVRERWNATVGGLVAGLVAGLALSVVMAANNVYAGNDIWVGMKIAAYPFLRDAAFQPGFAPAPVALGLACHFAVSAAWGVLFGWIAFGLARTATLLMGVLWGFVVWIGMFYVVLPLVGAGSVAAAVPVSMAIAEHILFGLVVALAFLPYQVPFARSAEIERGAAGGAPVPA